MKDLGTKLLTISDLAERWGVSTKTCYRIVANYIHILDPTKPGRAYRFEPENVRKFEEARRMVKEDE